MSSGEGDLQARLQLAAAVIEHTREAVMGGEVLTTTPSTVAVMFVSGELVTSNRRH